MELETSSTRSWSGIRTTGWSSRYTRPSRPGKPTRERHRRARGLPGAQRQHWHGRPGDLVIAEAVRSMVFARFEAAGGEAWGFRAETE